MSAVGTVAWAAEGVVSSGVHDLPAPCAARAGGVAGSTDAEAEQLLPLGRRKGDGPLHEISDDGWAFTLQLNLTSVFYSNRAAAHMAMERFEHALRDANECVSSQ